MQKSTKRQAPMTVFVAFAVALLMAFSAVPTQAIAEIVSAEEEDVQQAAIPDGSEQIVSDEPAQVPSASQQSYGKESTEEETEEEGAAKEEDTEEEDVQEEVSEEEAADKEAAKEVAPTQDGSNVPSEQTEPAGIEDAGTEVIEESVVSAQDAAEDKADADAIADAQNEKPMKVSYSAHMQGSGWMDFVSDGATAGITGKSLRMEGVKILLDKGDETLGGGIEYRMHMQRHGWGSWSRDGAVGGVVGNALRMEALQVRLYGSLAAKYHVYYSVHVQRLGWMAWGKDGESVGTAGQSLRVEAIKIKLVKDGEDPALDTSFIDCDKSFDGGKLLSVQAHVQRLGWMDAVGNGEVAGTTGMSLRVEALNIASVGLDVPGSLMAEGHVQGKGWTGYTTGMVGTTGQGKRLEAIRIKLTGEAASKYDVYYRTHVARIGWLNWASNGANSGTSGMAAPVEAVQIMLSPKGVTPVLASGAASEAFLSGTSVRYKAHCQSYGWRSEVSDGATAGTTGQGKRMEALTMRLDGGNVGGSVNYQAYVSGKGWQGYKTANVVAGTEGQGRAIEAVTIGLTGRALTMYNVYYRAHVSGAGWLDWAMNGEVAGAPGTGHAVEAIQVLLVPKGNGAPGATSNHEIGRSYFEDPMVRKAQGYSSPTNWLILVDTDTCKLAVFTGSYGNWKLYDKWTVSVGAPDSPSVTGVYSVGERGYEFGHGYSCYYWVSWNGPYLFHTIKYNEGTFVVQDGRLGQHISGGCVRMPLNRAKFIYDTIPYGTTVVTY